jgi:sulfatase modifying factor 1
LPTEAEWEYAYRGGTTTTFYWGNSADSLNYYAWAAPYSESALRPGGGRLPNAYGLYDMAGNVWEWCNDWFGPYSAAAQTNPTGPASGTDCPIRGASWALWPAIDYGAAYRDRHEGRGIKGNEIGFRIVLPQ